MTPDALILAADSALRTLWAEPRAARANPAQGVASVEMSEAERGESAALMRVNHVGEVCAQALYTAQALATKDNALRQHLTVACDEETDHLAWCEQRVRELDSRVSLFAPVWYAGSFAIGALAGLAGDRNSLGFVAETEKQVIEHLESHLHENGLPEDDERSRRIVAQMQADEAKHGSDAKAAGGRDLPRPVRELMRRTAKLMTSTAYRV